MCVCSTPNVILLQRCFRKVTVDLVHAMKVYIRSRGKVPLILNLLTGWKWVVVSRSGWFNLGNKKIGSSALVACVGPRVHVDGSVKNGTFTVLQERIKPWLLYNTALSFPPHILSSFSKLSTIIVGKASLTLNIARGVLWGPHRVIFCDPAVPITTNLLLIFVCVAHQLKINITQLDL